MQHGVTAAAVLRKPGGADDAGLAGALIGFAVVGASEGALAAVVMDGHVGWAPAVLVHPVRDRVMHDSGSVVGIAEAAPDSGSESLLHVEVSGGQPPPAQGADQFGDRDGFGVDRGKQFGGTECFQLGAHRDEQLCPAAQRCRVSWGPGSPSAVHRCAQMRNAVSTASKVVTGPTRCSSRRCARWAATTSGRSVRSGCAILARSGRSTPGGAGTRSGGGRTASVPARPSGRAQPDSCRVCDGSSRGDAADAGGGVRAVFGLEFSGRANMPDIVNAVCATAARTRVELVLVDFTDRI